MINIPKPDAALLKALADAGALPKDAVPAPTRRPASRRRPRRRQTRQIRIPVQEDDQFWPFVVVILVCLVVFCLLS